MPSIPASTADDYRSKGILLVTVLFFSLLLSIKSLVIEWITPAEESQGDIHPNILMIVLDDLGYDDTSAINTQGLSTPNIKQLAQEGVTFRRHYADSTCTPSRVGMLTGRYPERSGFRPIGFEIPAEFPTIAEQLQANGYTTYMTGKWHAGEGRTQAWPQHKGFPQWFGFLNQWELAGEVNDSHKGVRRPTYLNPMLRINGGELEQKEGHLTDILTDHTVRKLKQLQASEKPWFLYHAFLAPHHPIQPHQRFRAQFPDTPEGNYKALVTQMDAAIGRILNAVDTENTLVVLVSDNGGTNIQRNNNFPFYGKKNEPYEGAYRTPLIISWPNYIPKGKFIDDVVMNVDIYPTLLSAAHTASPQDIDGKNLLPLIMSDAPIDRRGRSWEVYGSNVNAMGFSFIDSSGDWRLASLQGLKPQLFDLADDATGETDVAEQHDDKVKQLKSEFWMEHWRNSVLPMTPRPGKPEGQTLYYGIDAMRTPYRYGFTIGLEIGPLPASVIEGQHPSGIVLAGQDNAWDLQYKPGQGVEWHIGDSVLLDPYFEPSQCNAIVLTGYLQPRGNMDKRDPFSEIKLYSSGFLRDVQSGINSSPVHDSTLESPTFVNLGGRAIFSNMMLSSFSDIYSPRVSSLYIDIYTELHRRKELLIADVKLMDAQLCKSKIK